jgi:hypothetical protein
LADATTHILSACLTVAFTTFITGGAKITRELVPFDHLIADTDRIDFIDRSLDVK